MTNKKRVSFIGRKWKGHIKDAPFISFGPVGTDLRKLSNSKCFSSVAEFSCLKSLAS